MDDKISGKSRRSIKGYLIRPRKQLRLTLAMLSTVIVLLAVLAAWFTSQVNAEIQAQQLHNPLVAHYLQDSVIPALRFLHGGILLLIVASIVAAILLTHQIYGPMVPILRHIQSLKDHDYSSRIHLRKGDELSEIADALNDLAGSLGKPVS
jgi:signal transduction histidine kinase